MVVSLYDPTTGGQFGDPIPPSTESYLQRREVAEWLMSVARVVLKVVGWGWIGAL